MQSVLADAALVELAKRRPATMRELEQIRGLGQGSLRRGGPELLEAVRAGAERADGPQIPLERLARGGFPDPGDAPLVALCEALVRARAREADLAYELIAARADLQAVVAAVRTGRRSPTCARCAAGGGSWSARSCWSCWTDACRCRCARGAWRSGGRPY